jgi:hypothetical protein
LHFPIGQIHAARMIHSGFLSEEDRKALTALARDGSSPCRVSQTGGMTQRSANTIAVLCIPTKADIRSRMNAP